MKLKILIASVLILFTIVACNHESNKSANVEEAINQIDEEKYKEKGLEIALYAQGAIGGALTNAMQEGGIPNALSVCNVKAIPITDSLSAFHNIKLQRVSDKNRNPKNKASTEDSIVLNKFKAMLAMDEPALPIVEQQGEKIIFYHAILANTKCMKCHGVVGEDINQDHYEKILSLYPNDLATGYEPGEIRGAFKITFN